MFKLLQQIQDSNPLDLGVLAKENIAKAQYASAKTIVCWDLNNCEVPESVDANRVSKNIQLALEKLNYRGSLSISAFGNIKLIPLAIQHALDSTGVWINHVPPGKDSSDKMLVELFCWAMDNTGANILVITGDSDFSDALHHLTMRNYNVLSAISLDVTLPPLIVTGKTVWLWKSLAAGGRPLTQGEISQIIAKNPPTPSNHQTKVQNPVRPKAPYSRIQCLTAI